MKNGTKLFIVGLLLTLSGTILLGLSHLVIVIQMNNLTSWTTPPGKFFTAITESYGWFPYILSILKIMIGLSLTYKSFSSEKKSSFSPTLLGNKNDLKENNKFQSAEIKNEKIKQFIKENYLLNEKVINAVYPTPFENYYLLDVEGEAQLVVIRKNLVLSVMDTDLNKKKELKRWFEDQLKQE